MRVAMDGGKYIKKKKVYYVDRRCYSARWFDNGPGWFDCWPELRAD